MEGSTRELKNFKDLVFNRSLFLESQKLSEEILSFMNDFGVVTIIHLPGFIEIKSHMLMELYKP